MAKKATKKAAPAGPAKAQSKIDLAKPVKVALLRP